MSIWEYFYDPILRAPTIASVLMCLSASLIGAIVFLRKESLIGEALSHASYPGVILGVVVLALFASSEESYFLTQAFILAGAALFSALGMYVIYYLVKKARLRTDSTLCFTLSTFFGIGVLFASFIQFHLSSYYKQIQVYLYGQVATLTDIHIAIFGVLSFFVLFAILMLYKEIKITTFDSAYAKSLGVNVEAVDFVVYALLIISLVTGIRSVGVVLMSAMLIAPSIAARQFTNRMSRMLMLAALFGSLSGIIGTIVSNELSKYLSQDSISRVSMPTGPVIVVASSFFALLSLFFAPNRGVAFRLIRGFLFRVQTGKENILKTIWRRGPDSEMRFSEIRKYHPYNPIYLYLILERLMLNGYLEKTKDGYLLTHDGIVRAEKIVRLHRLWEVYLVDYIGLKAEKVHKSAEEMEHIITKELEVELTRLLNDPKMDPHKQPIPR